MVLVYVPIFAQTKSPSHVGKYTIQKADGLDELRQYAAHEFQRQTLKYHEHLIVKVVWLYHLIIFSGMFVQNKSGNGWPAV